MRAGGGKSKGAGFEREVCKALSLWTTKGKKEDVFWRSAMSGGRATVGARRGANMAAQAGDITATSREGHKLIDEVFIECKFYRDLSLLPFFLGQEKGKLHEFWYKARLQADELDKKAMLIARQNRYPTLVVLSSPITSLTCNWYKGRMIPKPFAQAVREGAYLYWFDQLFSRPE